MNKIVELPLVEPMCKTYQNQAAATAIIGENPSIRNWYLNEAVDLICTRGFLTGRTTPDFWMLKAEWESNPHIEAIRVPFRFLNGDINRIIRRMLDAGYYVYIYNVDDYYIQGKSWYREKHIGHDGLICGYNDENKTYCIYSYDSNWVCQKYWTPQRCLDEARNSCMKEGTYGWIAALKPKKQQVDFSAETACKRIREYLDSSLEKHPKEAPGKPQGIVVQYYLFEYTNKLHEGTIPYERKDRRIFRQLWEHKKIMLERIKAIEQFYGWDCAISTRYAPLVELADHMRMQYALYVLKERDGVLPRLARQIIELMDRERKILTDLLEKVANKK